MANSTTLVLISLGVFYEAYQRFVTPPEVKSVVLIVVGLIAVVVNLVTALLVRRGSETDLNLRSAFLHLMGDVISTIGAVIAGMVSIRRRLSRTKSVSKPAVYSIIESAHGVTTCATKWYPRPARG